MEFERRRFRVQFRSVIDGLIFGVQENNGHKV